MLLVPMLMMMLMLMLLLPLLLLAGAGHLEWPGSRRLEKREQEACCRPGARMRASRWWRTGGRQEGWPEASAEEGADARTTRVTAVSWCAVYCFANFGRVDFDNMSHSA